MNTFIEDEWAVATLPDGTMRLVQAAGSASPATLDFGRFGRVRASHLLAARRGCTFWIEEGALREMSAADVLRVDANFFTAGGDAAAVSDNRAIEDANTSQALSTDDIEALKTQAPGAAVLASVLAGSATFAKRTALAQAKYVARKRAKFLAYVRLEEGTARALCAFWAQRDARRVLDLRLDTLALICAQADVRPGRPDAILLWDDATLGFLAGALCARNGALRGLAVAHAGTQFQMPNAAAFNLAADVRGRIVGAPIAKITAEGIVLPEERDALTPEASALPEDKLAAVRAKYALRKARRDLLASLFSGRSFDALVVAVGPIAGSSAAGASKGAQHYHTASDALAVVRALVPFVRPAGRVVVYSPFRGLVLPAAAWMRASVGRFADVSAAESFMRPYQPAPGKVHPAMTSPGGTGAIVAATVIHSL